VRRVYPAALSVAKFRHACAELRPHLVLSINYAPPLGLLCSLEGVPYVSWSIDPLPAARQQMLPGTNAELCLCFMHRKRLVESFRAAGFTAEYLPLAAASRRVVAWESAPRALEPGPRVSFVGGSLASDDAALERFYSRASFQQPLRERIDDWLNEWLQHADSDSSWSGIDAEHELPPWLAAHVAPGNRLEFIELLNGRLGYWHRRRVVQALAGEGLVVYGDEAWAQVARDYRGLAEHGEQVTSIYRLSRCNLDIVRLYQREIATLRAMDVLAAGGLLLTERGGDLEDLLPERPFLSYADLEGVRLALAELDEHPARMRELARAGQREVVRAHLIEHRVTHMLEACAERGWL
jgi:hypothetical protein